MSKKVVRLTESQLRLMINRVINEQTAPAVKPSVAPQQGQQSTFTPFTTNFENLFDSGRYSFNTSYTNIVSEKIVKIADFIKDGNIKDFKIVINSGESQVPNQPPFDKEKGSLAKKRAEVLKYNLEQTLLPILPVKPVIEITQPVVGGPSWDPKLGKDNNVYKEHQYVNVLVKSLKETIPPPIIKTPPPPPKIEKTEFMISWTLDKRCDRIKYFNTYAEMSVMVNKLKGAGYNTSQSETRGGGVPWSASVKLQQLSQDPPSEFFDGPFFDSCEQKFVGRK
jgi:hypothetical protein